MWAKVESFALLFLKKFIFKNLELEESPENSFYGVVDIPDEITSEAMTSHSEHLSLNLGINQTEVEAGEGNDW